jgi:hypothetical protein
MTPDRLIDRVTAQAALGAGLVALAAGWMAGAPGVVGAAGAGALAVVNFRWLARGATRATGSGGPRLMALGLGLRCLGAFGALALLLASGWAHPLAALAGLSVLPPVLIAHGIVAGRG